MADNMNLDGFSGALICMLMEGLPDMAGDSALTDDANSGESDNCSIECNDDQTNMMITCADATETCDDTNEYCAKDNTVNAVMPLADLEDVTVEVEMCSVYTKAPFPELIGVKSCITFAAAMDMNMAMTPETDSNSEDMMEDMVIECGYTVGDTSCQCSFCDGNNEISLSCPSLGFQSEVCMNVEQDLDFAGTGDVPEGSSSVMRFTKIESSAFGITPSVVSFSFVVLTLAALF